MNINSINNINPIEILKQLNFSEDDIDLIMKSDLSPTQQFEHSILDFEIIVKKYKSFFNLNLIQYFFEKAKNKESFTEEEIFIYQEAWENWFLLLFTIGKSHIFKENNNLNLLIRYNNEIYQYISSENANQILYKDLN